MYYLLFYMAVCLVEIASVGMDQIVCSVTKKDLFDTVTCIHLRLVLIMPHIVI